MNGLFLVLVHILFTEENPRSQSALVTGNAATDDNICCILAGTVLGSEI